MTPRAARVAPLLFGSGFCALVYQMAWLREFRLVFGASTAASAAVVAIFVGGLGAGGLLIGARADRHPRPLWLYARLETLIALSAALTPALLWLVRRAYVAAGGTLALGIAGGTLVRLFLAAFVLALPTWLMGGTLPAAARAVATADDEGRRSVGLLYGVNTLGAVAGSFLATFFMLEIFGTRRTLWLACLLNALVAIVARQMARALPVEEATTPTSREAGASAAPPWFVLTAAAVVGFVFFLMELIWYRMLGPLLGGTIFTFGLILAVALLGVGLGGAAYGQLRRERPATVKGFAYTCLLEAVALAFPYALGDRIAILALVLRPLGSVALLWGHVLGWTLVCFVAVLPAAIVAGYQFPLLIALLGRGKQDVGRQVGLAYAWNTLGAIGGSLAGGFGLIPLLSAPGAWRATALALVALGLAAIALSLRHEGSGQRALAPGALAVLTVFMLAATGPTAAWRHSGIGAGRAALPSSLNALRDWLNYQRGAVVWEADGVESSVALEAIGPGLAFVINGKVDGNSRSDAPTMVMGGLLGAFVHPDPRRSLVIELGTGGTAGWLAAVPTMERTDVVELEPLLLNVARDCASVNQSVLTNPKVHITLGDAREALLVSRQTYDIIFSEPSNPYRAGVASLYTREYYEACAKRLRAGGLFLQWVQAYEIDTRTLREIYATLASVFPEVDTWQIHRGDLLLVASHQPLVYDAAALRARLQQEPYQSGVRHAWRATDLEGFLAHFVARSSLARAIAAKEADFVNTDDENHVEFGFARSVGRLEIKIDEVREAARLRGEHRPPMEGGDVDWQRVEDERVFFYPQEGRAPILRSQFSADQLRLATAAEHYESGDARGALAAWRSLNRGPRNLKELPLAAAALAEIGDESALPHIERIRAFLPVEADALLARLRSRRDRIDEAVTALENALAGFHHDPWPDPALMRSALDLVVELTRRNAALAPRLFQSVRSPFVLHGLETDRVAAVGELVSMGLQTRSRNSPGRLMRWRRFGYSTGVFDARRQGGGGKETTCEPCRLPGHME